MGSINVIQTYGEVKKVLLSISGNHDRPWHKAVANIPDVALPYQVRVIHSSFTLAQTFLKWRSGSLWKGFSSCRL